MDLVHEMLNMSSFIAMDWTRSKSIYFKAASVSESCLHYERSMASNSPKVIFVIKDVCVQVAERVFSLFVCIKHVTQKVNKIHFINLTIFY